jgi:glycerol-1-phosphate dehydrogenase [NAD(P)+]
MNDPIIPYIVSQDAVQPLLEYCAASNLKKLFVIADPNTYRVLGQRAEQALRAAGIDVKLILITGEEIAADEHYLVQAFLQTEGEDRQYVAVGSGTITDITRFVSHRSRAGFISLPTAPSVDGYTSNVAPLVVSNYKATIAAQAPTAVFADLPTLCASPRPMIAAGLGDLLGKYTSLADWQLGALLYDEPYDQSIYQMMRKSVDRTVDAIDSLAQASCDGITFLMDGLIESGFGIMQFGDSRPASGSEHHIAHFWEMKLIQEGRPAILHGAKVGVSTIISARRYDMLRQMSREEAARRLDGKTLPPREQLLAEIQAGYGPVTSLITEIQAPLLGMTQADYQALSARILENWAEVQAIAQTVPHPDQISAWLQAVDGPTSSDQIGLSSHETQLGIQSGHYLRDRFTLNRLAFWLDIPYGLQP